MAPHGRAAPRRRLHLLWLEEVLTSVTAIQCDQKGLVAQRRPNVFDSFADLVRDASKDKHLLIRLIVRDHTHAMVAHVGDPVAAD